MKKQLLFLTFILLFNLIAKAQAPVIYPVYNTSDLEAALYSAYPNSNPSLMPGDIIQIKSDLDVSSMDLPIIIPSGVIVQGTYDLLSEPNSNGSTYSNANGTTLTSHHKVDFKIHHNDVEKIFVFKLLPGTSLAPTTIRNLKIVGPDWSWIDHNNYKAANAFQSAGIFLDYGNTDGYFNINHCEIFGFSYAGVFGSKGAIHMNFDHNYIHHIKEIVNDVSGGYANWIQSNEIASDIAFENIIFDDCRAAIDGQSGISNWAINNCTMTQFMYGGIAKHNGSFSIMHDGVANCSYYNRNQNPHLTAAGDKFGIYDNAGGNVTMTNNISHFQLAEDYSRGGLCGFPYPYYPPISQINYVAPNCTTNVLSSTPTDAGDLNDGGWINIPIGFSYDYFGTTYQFVNVCTNGFIQFGSNLDFSLPVNTIPLDVDINSSSPNNFIAMCWTDLDFTNQGTISYCTSTINGVNVFEVQWQGGKFVNSTHANTNDITGHIRFFENSPIIEIYIEHINTNSTLIYKTIGIENEIGAGVPYLNYQNYSTGNPFGIRFEIPIKFKVELKNNTMASTGIERPTHYGGYATIADNHIESCIWDSGDDATNISSTDNSFDYLPGQNVGQNCPQPPECTIQLKDQMNVVLPKTNIDTDHSPDGYSYISAGSPINIAVSPGSLGSQTNAFIIQPNPNHGNPLTYNSSANNDFFNDREIIGPATGTQIKANYSYDVARPGLYGIDALAVAATNSTNPLWQEYNSSTWQHIPLIVKPSYDESHLIFNIKDSYYEEYTANGSQPYPETHVLKTAELNGHRIWQEDIAEGGDGWERIDIPMNSINPDWIVPASDENKNLLTFSINFDSQTISTSSVQGVSVWVDDVYINRYSSAKGTNLIADGDIENEGCGKLTTYAALGANPTCSWFKLGNTSPNYPIVCVTTSFAANNSGNDEVLYNDGNPILISQAGSWICDSYLNGRERKSGQTALVLDLPRIDGDGCPYYIVPPLSQVPTTVPIDPLDIYQFYPGVISVYTLFEYPRCGAFTDDLEDQFSDLTTASGTYSGNFNLNHNLRIDAGNTLELSNATLAIGSGVSITVPNTSKLNIITSNLSACSEMWKGIIVEDGGIVNVTDGSTIEDAQYGIQAHNGSEVHVDASTFTNDFIGINFTSVGAVGAATITASITNTTFQSTQLKNGYLNQTPAPLTHTFKGINIDNNTFLNIGGGASSDNIFSGLNYGIVSENSNVNIEHSIFRDIKKYDNYLLGIAAFHVYKGTAIIGVGDFTNTLTVNGNSSSPLEFENCQTGIRIWKMNAECFDLNANNCDVGINVSSQDNCNSKIRNNELNCNSYGIIGLLNDYANSFSIYENKIDVGSRLNLDGGVPNAIAILVGGNSVKNTNRLIKLNEIKLHDFAQHGIFANAIYGYTIDHNYVNMYNANSNLTGINLTQGRQCTLNCNSISGTGSIFTLDQQAALWFQDSPENTISCNTVQKTYTGIGFMGTCIGGSGTNLHSNDIGEHNIGLYYKGTATRVDKQNFKGNSWYWDNYSIQGALDEDLNWVNFDQYQVDQTGPRFPNGSALTNHPTPNNNQNISEVWPLAFIQDYPGTDESCGHQLLPNEITCGIETGGGDGGSNRRAALNLEGSQDYDEETKWKTRERLYEKLLNEPNYLDSDTVYIQFFQQMAGSYLKQIAQLNKSKDEIYINSQSLLQTISSRTLQINLNTTQIAKCDSLLHSDGISTAVIDSLKLAHYNIVQNTSLLVNQNNADLALVKTAKENSTDVLNAANSTISSSKIYEENEKQVNDIYFQIIYKEHLEQLPNFSSQILSIANQCPLAGGPAVYKARTLAALIDPDLRYDDQLACSQAGISWRTSQRKEDSSLNVYPNPANDNATFKYIISSDATLVIYSKVGEVIKVEKISKDSKSCIVDLANFISGIYTCRLLESGTVNFVQLVVIH